MHRHFGVRNDGFGRGNGGGSISSGGLNFTLNEDGASYSVAGIQEDTPADIVIVSELEGLPVTSIKNSAFANCSSLTSIVIPEGVTSIESSTFSHCCSLKSVTFEGKSQLTSIGNAAFDCCESLTSFVIPEGVTSIGFSAFEGCESLTSIVIPKSVTSIGQSAFCYDPPQKVYYGGTPEDWKNITIGNKGYSSDIFRPFTSPQYYYSSTEPDEAKWAESKYWWHYDPVTGETVEWTKEE